MRWFLIIVLIFVLVVDVGVGSIVKEYEVDTYGRHHSEESNKNKGVEGPFILGAKAGISRLLDFSEANDKAITALSTFVIAIFTIILAIATSKLRDISDRQVKALVNTERPWMFVHKFKLRQREISERMIPNNWYISFEWRNFGRTAALIEEHIAGIQDITTLSNSPDYTKCSPLDMLAQTIAANETCGTREFGPAIQTRDNGAHIRYVVFGRLTYRDLAGDRHHTGFAMEVWSVGRAGTTYPSHKYEYWD